MFDLRMNLAHFHQKIDLKKASIRRLLRLSMALLVLVLIGSMGVTASELSPTLSSESYLPAYFPIGSGYVDVIPHQIVRANDDRLYLFAAVASGSRTIRSYWMINAGLPMSAADFSAGPEIGEASPVISVNPVYDGANTIHVLINLGDGTLKDYPFDITTYSYRSARILAPDSQSGNPAGGSGYVDMGTSGISSVFDQNGLLHIAYWSAGNHITHVAFTYSPATNAWSQSSGPTQVDAGGTNDNHPSVAVSPVDQSLTVAWVSGTNGAGKVFVRTRSLNDTWDNPLQINTADVWTSPNSGLNIDQGPSLLIDSHGIKHVAYIENWRVSAPYDYGRIHYVRNEGSTWIDQYIGSYTHDPALAVDGLGQVYLLGHGYPLNGSCTSTDDICTFQRNADGTWGVPQLFALHPPSSSFDAGASVKWSVVGLNRAEVIEFLFFSTPYNSPTLYYGRLAQSVLVSTPTATLTSTPVPTGNATSTPTATPTSTPVPTGNATSTPTATPMSTPVPTGTATPTSTRTATATSARTSTPTLARTATATSARTSTPTLARTATATPAPTATLTFTATPVPTAPGSFPVNGVLDNFNRANGGLGANWGGTISGYQVATNQLKVGSGQDIYWKATNFGANQEVYVTLVNLQSSASEIDLLLKSQSNNTWGNGVIEVWYDPVGQKVQVWTYDGAHGWLQRGANLPVIFANGDQFGAAATASGQVTIYRNGTLLGTRDVTGWTYSANGGYIGLWFINASTMLLDNFGGGNIVNGP